MSPEHARGARTGRCLVLATALLVGACGSGEAGDDPAAAGEAAARVFEHEGGRTEIPTDPQRVVVLWDGPRLDVALMCGVTVAGGGHSQVIPGGFPDWHDPADVAGIADIGWAEVDVEAIAALRPDLIVTEPEAEVNGVLPDIAPAVSLDLSGNWWTTTEDWKDAHRRLGELYGCTDTVEAEIAAVEERIAALRERIGDPDGLTVSVVRISAQYGPSVYSNRLYSAILGELGVDQPPAQRVEGGIDFDTEFSLERLPELDADVLLVRGLDEGDGEATNQRYFEEQVRANPLWNGLAAVRADQAHVVTGAEWNSTGGFEAANLILDDLEDTLVDADPDVLGE